VDIEPLQICLMLGRMDGLK